MSIALPTPVQCSFDFLNPFMSAAIITPSGKYPLWTRGSNNQTFTGLTTEPGLSDLKALSFVTDITVDMDLGQVPTLSVTLTPPLDDAIKFLDSELCVVGINYIQFQFGYANGAYINGVNGPILSPIYTGIMMPMPDITLGADPAIVLHARATRSSSMDALHSGKTYPPQTILSLINSILQDQGFGPADRSAVTPGSKSDTILQQTITYPMAWNTGLMALQDLCRRARCRLCLNYGPNATIGGDITLSTNYAAIVPTAQDSQEIPDFTLAFFDLAQGTLGGAMYPILSCSTDTTSLWLPGIKKMMLSDVDPLSKKQANIPVGDGDTQVNRTAPAANSGGVSNITACPDPVFGEFRDYIKIHGAPEDRSAVEQAQSAFEAYTRAMGVHLNVETIGVPIVYPGMIASVKGLGFRLSSPTSGNYGIRKVSHKIGLSGYSTSLEMTSNVGSFLDAQIGIPADGPQNTHDAPADNAGSGTTVSVTAQVSASG